MITLGFQTSPTTTYQPIIWKRLF